jgi:tRNA(fMet)-specific endonuclease VapC
MEARLLDSDVFSFFFKRDTRRRLYEPEIRGYQLCLCFQTVAELKAWAIERNWGKDAPGFP